MVERGDVGGGHSCERQRGDVVDAQLSPTERERAEHVPAAGDDHELGGPGRSDLVDEGIEEVEELRSVGNRLVVATCVLHQQQCRAAPPAEPGHAQQRRQPIAVHGPAAGRDREGHGTSVQLGKARRQRLLLDERDHAAVVEEPLDENCRWHGRCDVVGQRATRWRDVPARRVMQGPEGATYRIDGGCLVSGEVIDEPGARVGWMAGRGPDHEIGRRGQLGGASAAGSEDHRDHRCRQVGGSGLRGLRSQVAHELPRRGRERGPRGSRPVGEIDHRRPPGGRHIEDPVALLLGHLGVGSLENDRVLGDHRDLAALHSGPSAQQAIARRLTGDFCVLAARQAAELQERAIVDERVDSLPSVSAVKALGSAAARTRRSRPARGGGDRCHCPCLLPISPSTGRCPAPWPPWRGSRQGR